MKTTLITALIAIMALSSCKISDLKSGTSLHKKETAERAEQLKGKRILNAYVESNGYNKFSSVNTYQVTAHEHWKGMMGNMGNPWPDSRPSFQMKFVPDVNQYNTKVELMSDKNKGDVWGTKGALSSVYYEESGKEREGIDEGKMSFMLANYQWWMEFPYRLNELTNVSYAGQQEREGQQYDLVLATWGNDLKVSKDYDQYVLWFNRSTGLIDLVSFTYRKVPMMSPSFMYGTAILSDYRKVNGINLPYSQKFQINGPSSEKKYAHHFEISKIEFNSFDKSEVLN
ncbi:MAG: hypothetical protein JKY48_10310 [Flavobacteriales bacterium]|nr:hypothetical protein [Flavobacteriales bacterium]